jgi:hypothetical protein
MDESEDKKTAPEEAEEETGDDPVESEMTGDTEEATVTEDTAVSDDLTTDTYRREEPDYMQEQKPNEFRNIKSTNSQIPSSGVYASNKSSGGLGKILFIVLALIVVGLIAASAYLLRSKFTNLTTQPSPTPSVAEVAEPTPSPEPSFDRSKFSIRVLNGTPTSGLAASVSAKLTELGYKSDKTGNATNSAFTKTVIKVKAGTEGLADQLIKDLAPDYVATAEGSLKESDTADSEVILGTK